MLVAALSGCGSSPLPYSGTSGDVEILQDSYYDPNGKKPDGELSSAAVGPGSKGCASTGRVLIGPGTRQDGPNSKLLGQNAGAPILLEQALRDEKAGMDTELKTLPAPGSDYLVGTDAEFAKTADGGLLLMHSGATNRQPPDDAAHADQRAIYAQLPANMKYRSAFSLWRSQDCGATWTGPSEVVDALTELTADPKTADAPDEPLSTGPPVLGECAWAQANQPPNGSGYPGGYDRPELYADPWITGRLVITAKCSAGTFPDNTHMVSKAVMFVSDDGGQTFRSPAYFIPAVPGQPADYVPFPMTSLPPTVSKASSPSPGPLMLANCTGKLSVGRYDYGDVAPAFQPVSRADCTLASPAPFTMKRFANVSSMSVSRVLTDDSGNPLSDTVRVAYPRDDPDQAGHIGIEIVTVH